MSRVLRTIVVLIPIARWPQPTGLLVWGYPALHKAQISKKKGQLIYANAPSLRIAQLDYMKDYNTKIRKGEGKKKKAQLHFNCNSYKTTRVLSKSYFSAFWVVSCCLQSTSVFYTVSVLLIPTQKKESQSSTNNLVEYRANTDHLLSHLPIFLAMSGDSIVIVCRHNLRV